MDDVDNALLSRLDSLQGMEKQDEEGAFGENVASRLRKFSSRQKAIAYVEINKLLLNIQFPNDPYFIPSHAIPLSSSSQLPYPTPSQHSPSQHAPHDNSNYYNY